MEKKINNRLIALKNNRLNFTVAKSGIYLGLIKIDNLSNFHFNLLLLESSL